MPVAPETVEPFSPIVRTQLFSARCRPRQHWAGAAMLLGWRARHPLGTCPGLGLYSARHQVKDRHEPHRPTDRSVLHRPPVPSWPGGVRACGSAPLSPRARSAYRPVTRRSGPRRSVRRLPTPSAAALTGTLRSQAPAGVEFTQQSSQLEQPRRTRLASCSPSSDGQGGDMRGIP